MTWDHLHEEDVLFEFNGEEASELTTGRFYVGTVDGFADFGVFITIGDRVTGLLHRSKLNRRLESLDWEEGDEVIVQVEEVKENGNIDLGWSIRQKSTEFRGQETDPESSEPEETEPQQEPEPEKVEEEPPATEPTSSDKEARTLKAVTRVSTGELSEVTGDRVRLEGKVDEIRQTSGPTVFRITDEDGHVECAAFESAGVRAYPDIETEDIVRIVGIVEHHRGEIQVETESIVSLSDDEKTAVIERISEAATKRATPSDQNLLCDDPELANHLDSFVDAARALREALFAGKTIVIRHPATVDGVIAGAGLEHALRSTFVSNGQAKADARLAIKRRPMDDPWYELGDAMYDLGANRNGDRPLIALVGAGTSESDSAALEFLDLYDIDTVIIDSFENGVAPEFAKVAVNAPSRSVGTISAHISGMIEPAVRSNLSGLPAISYSRNPPALYEELAADSGLNGESIRERHEALGLIAYYHRHDDKRELVEDLLFSDSPALSGHISGQYRERVAVAIRTAQANCDRLSMVGTAITFLDAEAHSHRFDFPPRDVLARELFEAEQSDHAVDAVIVLAADEAYLSGEIGMDPNTLADALEERVPDSAVGVVRDRVTFLAGRRDEIKTSFVEVLSEQTP